MQLRGDELIGHHGMACYFGHSHITSTRDIHPHSIARLKHKQCLAVPTPAASRNETMIDSVLPASTSGPGTKARVEFAIPLTFLAGVNSMLFGFDRVDHPSATYILTISVLENREKH